MPLSFETDIPRPTHPDTFEQLCANVYGTRFGDPLPSVNGRTGQKQTGLDILVALPEKGWIGVQCKKYVLTTLTEKTLAQDLAKADDAGWQVDMLIFATTAQRDAKLVKWASELSDKRLAEGKFRVHIEFWKDICNHIVGNPRLQHEYAPSLPGGIVWEIKEAQAESNQRATRIEALVAELLKKRAELSTSGLRNDEHGRRVVEVWREYIVSRPIANVHKVRRCSILVMAIGMIGYATTWAGLLHFGISLSKYMMPTVMLLMIGGTLLIACNHLARRIPIMASPLHRSALMESSRAGEIYLTRIFAHCPQCGERMKYKFLGPLKGPMYRRLVCPRYGSAHSLELDYTTMPDAGSERS